MNEMRPEFAERTAIEKLMSREGPVTGSRLIDFPAICGYLPDADGVFAGEHGAGGKVGICNYRAHQLEGSLGV